MSGALYYWDSSTNSYKLAAVGQKGDKGDTGATGADSTVPGPQGPQGPAGPANTLTIGTVSPGSAAGATISGTSPNQTLNLTLPQGDVGPTGAGYYAHTQYTTAVSTGSTTFVINDPSTVSSLAFRVNDRVIGRTVGDNTKYFEGVVTATGTSPLSLTINVDTSVGTGANLAGYVISLVGAKGDAATVSVGTVTTGAAGSSATVANSGTTNAAVLDFTIPKGDKGATGQGLVAGGTAGQYLTKVNGTDYNTQWSTLDLTGYATKTGTETLTNKTITNATLNDSGTSTDPLIINSANGHGGTGYAGLITLKNTSTSATNITKAIRMNATGTLEIINDAYTAALLTLTDSGKVGIIKNTSATSGAPNNNALAFDNHSYLFDDGNLHIHSNSGSVWINSLDGSAVQVNTQINSGSGGLTVGGNITAGNISDSGWIQITAMSNGFTVAGAIYYRKLNGVVWLRGSVYNGTAGTTAFTLPTGYRPATSWVVAAQQYGTSSIDYVTVNTDGTVQPSGTGTWFNISFPLG